MLSGALCFIAAGIFIWIRVKVDEGILPGVVLVRGAAITGILFFGAIAVYIVFKLRDTKPGLVIGPEGIYNNTNATGPQMIPWRDIVEIETANVRSAKFLLVHVRNPEKYLAEAGQPKRFLMMLNRRTYSTPLSITTNAIQCRYKDLIENLRIMSQEYKTGTKRESL